MKPAIESLMGERGRLRTSHEMLKAALETSTREGYSKFYIAVADYMEAGMSRLDAQDVKMLARLEERLGTPSTEQQDIINEVRRRLAGNRALLARYLACRAALAADPENPDAIAAYESISHQYIDYIHNEMGHHAPSTDLARELFTETDWTDIADIDAGYFSHERELYSRMLDARPDSVPLGMAAEEYVEQYRRDRG
jgi:hypothetical protein